MQKSNSAVLFVYGTKVAVADAVVNGSNDLHSTVSSVFGKCLQPGIRFRIRSFARVPTGHNPSGAVHTGKHVTVLALNHLSFPLLARLGIRERRIFIFESGTAAAPSGASGAAVTNAESFVFPVSICTGRRVFSHFLIPLKAVRQPLIRIGINRHLLRGRFIRQVFVKIPRGVEHFGGGVLIENVLLDFGSKLNARLNHLPLLVN